MPSILTIVSTNYDLLTDKTSQEIKMDVSTIAKNTNTVFSLPEVALQINEWNLQLAIAVSSKP